MAKKTAYFTITFLFAGMLLGFAQERLVTKANEKYEEYSFNPAIDIYKKVLDKGFVSAEVHRP